MKHGKQGEGGGAKPKYASAGEIRKATKSYFDTCIKDKQMPNKAGLCVSLKISRDTYNEYKKKYPDTLKGIEAYIENCWVQRLNSNAPTGAIFYLKNAFKDDYRDKHETDITSKGERIEGINYIVPKNPNETHT